MAKRGHVVARGHARLRCLLADLLDPGAGQLSPGLVFLHGDIRARWDELDRRIAAFYAEFAAMAQTDGRARRLTGLSRIGAWHAGALAAAVDRSTTFATGRYLAVWREVVPSQGYHRRRAAAARDDDARQSLPVRDADPGRAICHAPVGDDKDCGSQSAACAASAAIRMAPLSLSP